MVGHKHRHGWIGHANGLLHGMPSTGTPTDTVLADRRQHQRHCNRHRARRRPSRYLWQRRRHRLAAPDDRRIGIVQRHKLYRPGQRRRHLRHQRSVPLRLPQHHRRRNDHRTRRFGAEHQFASQGGHHVPRLARGQRRVRRHRHRARQHNQLPGSHHDRRQCRQPKRQQFAVHAVLAEAGSRRRIRSRRPMLARWRRHADAGW